MRSRTPTHPSLAALRRRLEAPEGAAWWRGLEELADSEAVRTQLQAEFPAPADPLLPTSRRDFLRLMAAALAMAGLVGCGERPAPRFAIPYREQPEQIVPGRPRFYATAVPFEGYAQPVLAETHMGRPTKLEGNPEHPVSGGATDAYTQAAILQLYDPDRSRQVTYHGKTSSWAAFEAAMIEARPRLARGAGLRILTGALTSPTLARQLQGLTTRYPNVRWHSFEPVGNGLREAGTRLAFGRPLEVHYRLQAADVVVSLEEDLLGPGPRQLALVRDWGLRRRQAQRAGPPLRLFVAESTPSQTGAVAERRLAVGARRLPVCLAGLAQALGLEIATARLTEAERGWVQAAAQALRRHAGRSLLAAGAHLDPAMQALTHAVNHRLGNTGRTLVYTDPVALAPPDGEHSLAVLARDMADGNVDALLLLDVNPAYSAPVDLEFARHMARVRLCIHVGLYADESAAASQWHLPLAHPLEAWSDARAVDGSVTLLQPVLRPLYDGRTAHEVMGLLLGEAGPSPHAQVRETWRQAWGADGFEARWREALHAGWVEGSVARPVSPRPPQAIPAMPAVPESAAVELVFRPDPGVWDGRLANSPWLQELPKPLTKLTWDNIVGLSPALAEAAGVANGDLVEIRHADRTLRGPAWILPGQAPRTITLYLGYGRRRAGRVGDGLGYDAYALRTLQGPWLATGAGVSRTGERVELATTQLHHGMAGQDLVRQVSDAQTSAAHPEEDHGRPTLYPVWKYEGYAWGMVIDLDLCSGCNACVVACQAENTVPVVGKEEVRRGREMHWLRVDRYYRGPLDDPQTYFMPVPCMHCERAPCEVGCPVNATVHGPEGLNQMIYSRCIGTRTCSNYCPYKVRRFNYFEYSATDEPSLIAQRNPDVTVRARGVMEKCTYCVQRIRAGRIEAKKENRRLRDGEVQTACQAACPSRAITFGDLNDPASQVAGARASPRNYSLLENLNTWPRTTYLAQLRPPPAEEAPEPGP